MALYVALTHEQASFLLERLGVMEADFEARLQNLCPDYLKTPEAQESYVASVFSHALLSANCHLLSYWDIQVFKDKFSKFLPHLNPDILQKIMQFQSQPTPDNKFIDKNDALTELKRHLNILPNYDEKISKALVVYFARRWDLDPLTLRYLIGNYENYYKVFHEYARHYIGMEAAQMACHMYDVMAELTWELDMITTEVASRGFNRTYVNQKASIDHYVNFVRSIIDEFRRDERLIYALYANIIQSSGYGKSRLVIEAGKRHLNTVHVNISPFDNGYPPSNATLRKYFAKHNDVGELVDFLIACYVVAYQRFTAFTSSEDTQIRPLSLLQEEDFSFRSYWDEVIALAKNRDDREVNRKLFAEQQADFRSSYYAKDKVIVNGRIQVKDRFVLSELVVVFDKNAELFENEPNSVFRKLIRALQAIDSANMLVLFTEATPKLEKYVPIRPMTSNYRPEHPRNHLLSPFYETLTYDVLSDVPSVPADSFDFNYLRQIFYQGRPLWRAIFENESTPKFAVKKMVDYAKSKLVSARNGRLPVLGQQETDIVSHTGFPKASNAAAIIAVLAVRFGIQGVIDHSVASLLMNSHMGTGMYIDEARSKMVVQYPPEPLLAEAACQCLHETGQLDYDRLSCYSRVFLSTCMRGFVQADDIDVLLARMILSLTFDSVILARTAPGADDVKIFSWPINVADFIGELIGDEYTKEYEEVFHKTPLACIPESMRNGEICITSWTALPPFMSNSPVIGEPWLEELFNKRTGVIFGDRQSRVDLLIPVRIQGDGSEFSYSMVMVQVKNNVNVRNRFKFAGPCLTPLYCIKSEPPNSYLSLYIETGPGFPLKDLDADKVDKHSRDFPHHLMVLGFESFGICSAEPFKSLFNLYHNRKLDYLDEDSRADVLYRMNPVAFRFVQESCRSM